MRSIHDIPAESAAETRRSERGFSVSRIWKGIYTVIVGILAGWQILTPNKRFIEAIVGLIVVGIIWNFSALQALWFIIVTYSFPFGISIGSSTFIFTLVIFIIYMVRVSSGHYRFHGDKLLNMPIALLVLAYIISFYNQDTDPFPMRFALIHTTNFFAIILLYYMLVNVLDDEEKLRKTITFLMVSGALVTFFASLELLFPGRVILPNIIYSEYKLSLVMKDVRVKGVFHDYELTAEFFAVNVPIIIFMVVRSKRFVTRTLYFALLLFMMFMLFATITRGAFVSLVIGLVYLTWICRKDLNIVQLTGLAAVSVGTLTIINTIMKRYTISGSLFDRLFATTFKQGLIPDSRTDAWSGAVERWLLHPVIGNGPGWDFRKRLVAKLWPHSTYLYYLNIIGVFGLLAFLFALYRLMRASMTELRQPLATAPFPRALMKVLHVSFVILIIDMIKVDYPRNGIYTYFVWILFAIISATRKIIDASVERERSTGGA